jgi:hypothetical protein
MNSSSKQYPRTIQAGCALTSDIVLLTCTLDSLVQGGYEDFSVVDTFAPGHPNSDNNSEWWTQTYDKQILTSIDIWSKYGLRCVLDRGGATRLYGARGNPNHTYQIPGAGVFNPQAQGYGYVSRIRSVGTGLYVCGDHRQFYRFDWDGKNLTAGRWLDMAGGMRQAPVSDNPPTDEAAYDHWLDAQSDSVEFRDLGGTEANDLYAVGDEVWHFDGKHWQSLKLPTDEPLNAIKVIDLQRVLLVGHNGTVLLGNAKEGFKDLSSVDDNQNFTSVEYFQDKLWLASNLGLFVYDFTKLRIEPYRTDLKVDLIDVHQLEAKDGVLWSFGYKDLAYWDSNKGNMRWVRVHHPDNPRVDEVPAKKARRQPPTEAGAEEVQAAAIARQAALSWLPQPRAGVLNIGGLMARVGHSGVGGFVQEQLQAFDLKPEQVLRVNKGERYTLPIPKQGVELVLQCMRKNGQDGQAPQHWGLAEVKLLTQNESPHDHWQGQWPGGLQPYSVQLLEQARNLWGAESAGNDLQKTFFADGPHGAAWAIILQWTGVANRLGHLKVMHMGGYMPWPEGA